MLAGEIRARKGMGMIGVGAGREARGATPGGETQATRASALLGREVRAATLAGETPAPRDGSCWEGGARGDARGGDPGGLGWVLLGREVRAATLAAETQAA
jgi:hypothetical protein